MDASPAPSLHQHVTLPTLTSLIRLLPLCLLLFLTTPHGLADHIHAFYTRRPYTKPSSRDMFPLKQDNIHLSKLPILFNSSVLRERIVLQPGTSLYALLNIPSVCTRQSPCFVLLEAWYDSNLPRDHKPDPYLLAANGTIPQPFPRYPTTRLADDEAFYTWRPYHYIPMTSITSTDEWHIRIFNHDSTVWNPLTATLRITISQRNELLCPKGPTNDTCSGRGSCEQGLCKCKNGFGGRFCETVIEDFPTSDFEVPPDGKRVFQYKTPFRAHVFTELRLLPPQTATSAARPVMFVKRYGENGGKMLANGPPLPTIYDEMFTDKVALSSQPAIQRVLSRDVQKGDIVYIAVFNFRSTPAWILGRHANLRSHTMQRRRPVRVALRVILCVDDPSLISTNTPSIIVRECPPRTMDGWQRSFGLFIGPFLLGSLTLMIMVVCVSVWANVFRQHMIEAMGVQIGPTGSVMNGMLLNGGVGGSTDGALGALGLADGASVISGMNHDRDKLSQEEVNAMFPTFQFTKGETKALCAVGDASCSVCLCAFEEGEALRRLPCGHSYHSHCLDQWLVTNATCPRCRKKARIHGGFFLRSRFFARISTFRRSARNALSLASSALRMTLGGGGTGGNSHSDNNNNGERDDDAIFTTIEDEGARDSTTPHHNQSHDRPEVLASV